MQRFMEVRDADKDGLIERADFKLVIQRFKVIGTSEEHLKKMSATYSKAYEQLGIVDGSTSLTYDEFVTRFAKQMVNSAEQMESIGDSTVSVLFEAICSGEITFKEWVDFYNALGIDPAHAKASFAAMDENGDGVVSKEGFAAYIKEFFLSTEDTLNSSILFGPL